MKSLYPFFILLTLFTLAASACQAAKPAMADLVLTNGIIYTMDKQRTVAQALAVKDGVIVYVGDKAGAQRLVGKDTRVIDLKGKLVLPAFVDSHSHATSGVSEIYEVSLYGLESMDAYQQAIQDFVQARPDLQGMQGAGWINALFGPHGPAKDILDEIVPNIPAVLYSEDYHSVWVNSKALEMAGITKSTPDPEGGLIERDADGNPSGALRESAADLVADVIPPYTVDQEIEGLKYFQKMANSYGMTTVYVPSVSEGVDLQALHDLDQSGQMTIRFPAAALVEANSDSSIVEKLARLREQEKGGRFEIIAGKIFIDGVLESSTAYLEEPYLHKPDSRGELLWDPQKYNEMCAALEEAGFQIHVHAIGDAAVRIALDGLAYSRRQNGDRGLRPMITHLQIVNSDDIARFARLKVIAVPQPYWFVVDTYYTQAVEYIGQERADRQYPMKSFLDNGVIVASSSDYPVTLPPNPLLAIELGVTRAVPADSDVYVDPDPARALAPAERVTVADMIASFTINGAYAAFLEDEIGSLEIGKKADLIVLDQNILKIEPSKIHNTVVLLTFFEGQEVYRHESYSE
jgi:predicted amidohydrolase YtcJ